MLQKTVQTIVSFKKTSFKRTAFVPLAETYHSGGYPIFANEGLTSVPKGRENVTILMNYFKE